VTGIGAGLVYFLIMPLIEPASRDVALIGASGAGYGILMAYALLFPERKVLLYFLIPIKVRWFVIGIGVMEFLMAWRTDGVAHLAHLGGLFFGLIYFRGGKNWLNEANRMIRQRRMKSKFRVVDKKPAGDDSGHGNPGSGSKTQDQVNVILEKISREGLDSLTAEEQDILRRASKKH
jgi:rhomboid family protein